MDLSLRAAALDDVVQDHGAVLAGVDVAVKDFVLEVVQSVLIPRLIVPIIIIDRSAERIKDGTAARFNEGHQVNIVTCLAAQTKIMDRTACVVEGDNEGVRVGIYGLRTDDGAAVGLTMADAENGAALPGLPDGLHVASAPEGNLLAHLHVALLGPRHVVLQEELHAQAVAVGVGVLVFSKGDGQHDGFGAARSHGGHAVFGVVGNGAATDVEAIALDDDADIHIIQRHEVVLVRHLQAHHLSFAHLPDAVQLHADVLVDVLDVEVFRLRREVGQHDAVHAEHAVVGQVAEVAAVIHAAIGRDGLIHPVPDGTAADVIARLDGFPEVDEVATRIAHGVGVLADMEGVLGSLAAAGGKLHPTDRRILIGTHIHDVVVALVLDRA